MIDVINNSANAGRGPTDAATTAPDANLGGFNRNVIVLLPDNIGSTNWDLNHNECIDENSFLQVIENNEKFAGMVEEFCGQGGFGG